MGRRTRPVPAWSARYRNFRAILYITMGCSGLFPLGHLMLSAGWEHAASATSLHWTLAMGASYLVGVFLYAMRFPESHFPGVFDYFLHSHQVTARPPAPSHRCQSAHVLTRAACAARWDRRTARPRRRSFTCALCWPPSSIGSACWRPTSGTWPRRARFRRRVHSSHASRPLSFCLGSTVPFFCVSWETRVRSRGVPHLCLATMIVTPSYSCMCVCCLGSPTKPPTTLLSVFLMQRARRRGPRTRAGALSSQLRGARRAATHRTPPRP